MKRMLNWFRLRKLESELDRELEYLPDDTALAARVALAESWAAGAVGFVRGSGEWWLAHRDEPASPDREELTAQVAAWLWAGPVGLLARDRNRTASEESR